MSSRQPKNRRGQAERRELTLASLLNSARKLFGTMGYAGTNLEDVAEDCNLTIGPIYHYYKSKLGLFTSVVEQIETELVEDIESRENVVAKDIWAGFMDHCEDPQFRQIILIDGPALLGSQRMMNGPITKAVRAHSQEVLGRKPDGLSMTMLMGALSNAALYIAQHGASRSDYDEISDLIKFHSKLSDLK